MRKFWCYCKRSPTGSMKQHYRILRFFSSFDILSNWCSVAMGGQLDRHILLLWQPAIVLCYLKLVWQINSLSLSPSRAIRGSDFRYNLWMQLITRLPPTSTAVPGCKITHDPPSRPAILTEFLYSLCILYMMFHSCTLFSFLHSLVKWRSIHTKLLTAVAKEVLGLIQTRSRESF